MLFWKGYLTATFKWSHTVNKQLHNLKQIVQQYQELIITFEQQE